MAATASREQLLAYIKKQKLQLHKLETEAQEASSEIKKLQEEVAKQRQDADQLQQALHIRDATIEKLTEAGQPSDEPERLRAELHLLKDNLEAQIGGLRQDIEERDAVIVQLSDASVATDEVARLERELQVQKESAEAQVCQLGQEVRSRDAVIQQLAEASGAVAEVARLQGELQAVKASTEIQLSQLQKELQNRDASLKQQSSLAAVDVDQSSGLERRELQDATEQLIADGSMSERVKEELEAQGRGTTTTEETERLRMELDASMEHVGRLQQIVQERESEACNLKRVSAALAADADNLQQESTRLAEEMNAKLDAALADVAEKAAALEKARLESNEKDSLLEELMEASRSGAEELANKTDCELKSVLARCAELEDERHGLQAALDALATDRGSIQAQCDILMAERGSLKEENVALETKLQRLKVLLAKSRRSSQAKAEELELARSEQLPPPKATVLMRVVQERGSTAQDLLTWCLISAIHSDPEGEGSEEKSTETAPGQDGATIPPDSSLQWVLQSTLEKWLQMGSTDLGGQRTEAEWPEPVQVQLEAVRGELESTIAEFTKYKQRAHAALKKATSSSTEAAQMAQNLGELQHELDATKRRAEAEQAETHNAIATLEREMEVQGQALRDSESRECALRAEMGDVSLQLRGVLSESQAMIEERDAALQELDEWKLECASLREKEATMQSSLREQADVVLRLREELGSLRREAEEAVFILPEESKMSPLAPASGEGENGGQPMQQQEEKQQQQQQPHLLAFESLQMRDRELKSRDATLIAELQEELYDAKLQLSLSNTQQDVLKDTIRNLECDLERHKSLKTSDAAELNVEYLKAAMVRYMSSHDVSEKRQLLVVIAALLHLDDTEVRRVDEQIQQMGQGTLGRVGGAVGGTVGAVWGFMYGGGGGIDAPVDEDPPVSSAALSRRRSA
jgi:hypothetical protein